MDIDACEWVSGRPARPIWDVGLEQQILTNAPWDQVPKAASPPHATWSLV